MKRPAGTMRRTLVRGSLALTCLLGILPAARPALAQPDAEAIDEARRLFQRALEYEQAENWGRALKLFREVGQVKLTPQVRYHIALCEENIGKPVAALGGYRLALRDADAVGPGFKQEVEGRIEQLLATIPKLVIERGEGAQAASIALDGTELGSVKIGTEVPVDPGPHTITATAPGHEDFMQTVTVDPKKTETVTVVMTKLPPKKEPGTTGTTDTGEPVVWKKPSRTVPYIVGGTGVALILTGGVFYYLRTSAISEVEDWCGGVDLDSSECDIAASGHTKDEADDNLQAAQAYTTVSLISAGVGVAAIGVAVTMILLEPKPPPGAQTAGIQLVPVASPSQAGLGLVGRF